MGHRAATVDHYPDHRAWAEMLAGFSEKNARLSEAVGKLRPAVPGGARQGPSLMAELERERSRIARELHAGAGQPLAGIKLHLEILDDSAATLPDAARATIGRIQTLAEEALGQVRALSHRLHPPDWQEMKATEALESLIEGSGLRGETEPDHGSAAAGGRTSAWRKVQLYRCAQECISNIIRHSGATKAAVSLRAEEGRVVLTVTDNGRGFDTAARQSGIGLRAIGENAESLGGNSTITSGADGTKIVVSLPCSEELNPPMELAPLTLILADDHGIVREGVAAFCKARPEVSLLGQCCDGQEALEMILARDPDFAVLDLDMPKLTGLEVIRRVRQAGSRTRLIVLSISRDRSVIRELFRSGADGYVLKDGPSRHIFEAINFVRDGGQYLTPLLRREAGEKKEEEADPLASLSKREYEVFSLLVDGVRPKDIAKSLEISPKTVDTYRANVMRKLDIEGVAGLVRFAIQRNLNTSAGKLAG